MHEAADKGCNATKHSRMYVLCPVVTKRYSRPCVTTTVYSLFVQLGPTTLVHASLRAAYPATYNYPRQPNANTQNSANG